MFDENIIMLTDSYKVSQYCQYPPKTEYISSYFESRGGDFFETVLFSPQYKCKKYLVGKVVTQEKIDYAEKRWNLHFGKNIFNRKGWEYILKEHNGHLPISIRWVEEGIPVSTSNALMTIENTDPNCWWLPNYLETLLVQTWYGSTVATQSREMKKTILKYLDATGDPSTIDFKLHDFGFRGVSSVESAALGGAAHLINFKGTDTAAGFELAYDYYGEEMAGFSIPASEHSTITSWGKGHELDAMSNMLTQFPDGLVACVSDSFNIWKACSDYWGTALKDKVLARDGVLVVRPDSGDPAETDLKVLEILGEKFGYSINKKGYKVLDPHVRIIQGDGIERQTLGYILNYLRTHDWSADNIAFGSGGGLLQKLNRDTSKYAFKCSSATVEGVERDVYKQPVTDAVKKSKSGKFALIYHNNSYKTISLKEFQEIDRWGVNFLVERYRNGKLLIETPFNRIRENAQCTKSL